VGRGLIEPHSHVELSSFETPAACLLASGAARIGPPAERSTPACPSCAALGGAGSAALWFAGSYNQPTHRTPAHRRASPAHKCLL